MCTEVAVVQPRLPPAVDLGTGSIQELETLPHVGPVRAQAIVSYRDIHDRPSLLALLRETGFSNFVNVLTAWKTGDREITLNGRPLFVRIDLRIAEDWELRTLPLFGPEKVSQFLRYRDSILDATAESPPDDQLFTKFLEESVLTNGLIGRWHDFCPYFRRVVVGNLTIAESGEHENDPNTSSVIDLARSSYLTLKKLPQFGTAKIVKLLELRRESDASSLTFQDICRLGGGLISGTLLTRWHEANLDVRVNDIGIPETFNPRTRENIAIQGLERVGEVTPLHIGSMDLVCPSCGAKMFAGENIDSRASPRFGLCCLSGKVSLPQLPAPPQDIMQFFDPTHRFHNEFVAHTWAYNTAMAFASLKVKIDKITLPYAFRINGSMYHSVGPILPAEDPADQVLQPRFSQIYLYDAEEAAEHRRRLMPNLNPDILQNLHQLMVQLNPFVETYRTAREKLDEATEEPPDLRLIIRANTTADRRRYNLPVTSEMAVLMPGDGAAAEPRDIVVFPRSGGLRRISDTHGSFDPLHYVLMFPRGEQGWQLYIPHEFGGKNVTSQQFYSYRLMVRDEVNIHLFRRLFKQYCVDEYAKIEANTLRYIETHQKEIRADLYQGIEDALAENQDPRLIGVRTVLPSSFNGGPRHMTQLYQDAMSLLRRYGKPDLFITMTCNPNWPEIKESLLPNQNATDRPDIIARVFNQKLKSLLDDIANEHVFGRPVARLFVVEFQKRGLPHAHILITLAPESKPRSADDYDNLVSAELPPEGTRLHQLVSENMMHGPCGLRNPDSPCMVEKNGQQGCSKRYPKDYAEQSYSPNDGYPKYKRPNNGRTVQVRGATLDNRWVVPYNPYLLLKYECHINVEICNSITAIKYLFKYVYKGHDRAIAEIQTTTADANPRAADVNEIVQYLDARYVSDSEACWRIFGFTLHCQYPAVIRLQVHEENSEFVTFNPESITTIDDVNRRVTTLTGWMAYNAEHDDGRDLLYHQFPEKFVWDCKTHTWHRRKKKMEVLGRMYWVHPSAGSRYFLRVLLCYVRGATSYKDIRTFEGVTYETFREACLARGLLEDDAQWHETMSEAAEHQSAGALRKTFVTILLFCVPSDPKSLWEKFRNVLTDDILYRRRQETGNSQLQPDTTVWDTGLAIIQFMLEERNKTLAQINLPDPEHALHFDMSDVYSDHELGLTAESADELVQKLNPEQLAIFNEATTTGCGGVFVYGAGGCGKSYLYRATIAYYREHGGETLPVASSGIAALILPEGRTAHSTFKIPIEITEQSQCSIKANSELADTIRNCPAVIWDEAPMTHRYAFEAVSRCFGDLMRTDTPFGGKTVLFGGDFRQILPVVVGGSRADIVNATINRSPLWSSLQLKRLETNMRVLQAEGADADGQAGFAEWLLRVGDGNEPTIQHGNLTCTDLIKLPDEICVESLEDLIDCVYPQFADKCLDAEYLENRGLMTPKNQDVYALNNTLLDVLPGDARTFLSGDSVIDPLDNEVYPTEFLNSLMMSGVPPHELKLKKNCVVMLLRNLSPRDGLCNGTRLIVTDFHARTIQCSILSGRHRGNQVFIPRIKINSSDSSFPFQLQRIQFPLIPAYVFTINKAQSQTLTKAGLYLPEHVFAHGQLYVAFSRATALDGIRVFAPCGKIDGLNGVHVRNIVYKEIFDM